MSEKYKYVVVGCGGIGSATLYSLAKEVGDQVLGLEQFRLGHARGASDDHSRIIRLAQTQPQHGVLAPHAYAAWYALEKESGQQLLYKTGALMIEPTAGPDVRTDDTPSRLDSRAAVFDQLGQPYEWINHERLTSRWPQFTLDGNERIMHQQDSGLIDAKRANAVHAALARAHGAAIREETPERALRSTPGAVEVICDDQTYRAEHVVVTADAWTNELLTQLDVEFPLTVTQEQVTYYATPNLLDFSLDQFPVFHWYGNRNYYGFPIYGEVATKLGEDLGGHPVTATSRTFDPDPVRQKQYREFLDQYIPGFVGPETYTKTCLYTCPPDRDFILGTIPNHPRVSTFIGAGHAYKFAALFGHILRDLALNRRPEHPIDSFRLDRPALTA